ncbi:MAG: aminodeoxychorismate synthase component I [Flavobacteriaceae bacterium]|nr:aminodeoxychorismate synthase component I [Flavobacteriaceae bacterium]
MSTWAATQKPFFFLIDFEMQKPVLCPLEEAKDLGFLFDIKGFRNFDPTTRKPKPIPLSIKPVAKETYTHAYQRVIDEIYKGNSFLLNLTFPSAIETPLDLEDVFHWAKAPYKLHHQGDFVVYSPECFVKIKNDHIYSYPMKGTIDARLPDAQNTLTTDPKEINEHNTIVDLIRNDLSKVAKEVQVKRFRYLDKIKTQKNEIYHTSSEIRGKLPPDWKSQLPDLLLSMLPAGSICGAPKAKTVSIIQEVEQDPRGYYTGIFGYFDGEELDSAVNIRFIEEKNNQLLYRSGGGITFLSDMESEYNELIEKIYVPVV